MAIVSSRRSHSRKSSRLNWKPSRGRGGGIRNLDFSIFSDDLWTLVFWTVVMYVLWSIESRFFFGWTLFDCLTPWVVYLSLRKEYYKGFACSILLGLLFEGTGTIPIWSGVFWFGLLHNFIFLIKPFFSWTKKETWLSANALAMVSGEAFLILAAMIRGHEFDFVGDLPLWTSILIRVALTLALMLLILRVNLSSIVASDRKAIAEAFE